ncbi:hypothetical protein ACTXT7_013313 [Hymenolepis weldensis]
MAPVNSDPESERKTENSLLYRCLLPDFLLCEVPVLRHTLRRPGDIAFPILKRLAMATD